MANKAILVVPAIILVLVGILLWAVLSGPQRHAAGHSSRERETATGPSRGDRDTMVSVTDDGPTYTISAQYPMTGTPFVDNVMATFVQEQADSFRTEVAGLRPLDSLKYPLYITYRACSFQDTILGVKFDVYSFLGGAHGQTKIFTFTCDSLNGRRLALSDFFDPSTHYLDSFAIYCRPELAQLIGERADPAWIEKGTVPTAETFSRSLLAEDGLHLFFEAYTVAPGVYGEQEVTLPWPRIVSLLRPELRDRMRGDQRPGR